MALPPAPVRVAVPLRGNPDQEPVQTMRPGGEKEATKARSRGDAPVEVNGVAGVDHMEPGKDGRRRCAAGEDRQAVIGL